MRNSGDLIGEISDLYIADNGIIIGFLIEEKGFFGRSRLLDTKSILSFGPDGVMIDSNDSLQPFTHEEGNYLLFDHGGLVGKEMLTEDGHKLGILDDVYFQEELGTIIGYEVSDGLFTDLTEGKKLISADQSLIVGKDAIVVATNKYL